MASLPEQGLPGKGPPEPVLIQRQPPPDQASLATLLQYEAELRRRATVSELVYFAANETRRIVDYDQMFVLRRAVAGSGYHVISASSIAVVDRNAPLIHAIEQAVGGFDVAKAQEIEATSASDDPSVAEYPFAHWFWQPVVDAQGQCFAGLLLARTTPFREAEHIRLARVGETMGHSWRALTGNKPVRRLPKLSLWQRRGLAAALIIGALFPVRMTALAPVEVVPARPFVVSAPYAGVIAQINVPPNGAVTPGQPVLTFEDIKVRNELQQAAQKLQVAKAKIEQATSASFGKAEEARDIAAMRAEFEVARAEYNYARDIMSKSQIAAPVGGMAIYSDRRDWEGRAVNVGDPILLIADPKAVAYRIDLPTREQMTLAPGAPVKVWLDAQPLWALAGRVEQASYVARPTAEGVLAFAVTAKPDGAPPRIGSRGTAKLYGERVPFIYTILKRPLAGVRQYFGL